MITIFVRILSIVAFVIVMQPSALATQADRSALLEWFVLVDGAEPTATPRAYRSYQDRDALALTVYVANRSDTAVLLDVDEVTRRTHVVATSADGRELQVEWQPTLHYSDTAGRSRLPLASGVQVRIEPGQSVGRDLRIRPGDFQRLDAGVYKIDLAIDSVAAAVRTATGELWMGRVVPERTDATITISPPTAPSAQAAMFKTQGLEALQESRGKDALEMYTRALAVSPNDLGALIGIGDAHLLLNAYREAIVAYERALSDSRTDPRGLRELLALAYVGLGDEASAARVIRRQSVSDQEVSVKIAELRGIVQRRAMRK